MKHCTIREVATGRTATVPLPLAHALVMAGKHEYTDKRKAKKADVPSSAPPPVQKEEPPKPWQSGLNYAPEDAEPAAKKTVAKKAGKKKRAYKRRDLKAED